MPFRAKNHQRWSKCENEFRGTSKNAGDTGSPEELVAFMASRTFVGVGVGGMPGERGA